MKNRWSIFIHIHLIKFFYKKTSTLIINATLTISSKSIISNRIKIIFISYVAHAISAKSLKNKNNRWASKHVFYISANDHFIVSTNDHFNVSINGHFERSFHAVKTNQINHHFFFVYNRFFNVSIFFFFFLQIQRSRHSRMITNVLQIKKTTMKIKNIKKKTANDENAMNQNVKNQVEISCYEISEYVDLMKYKKFFSFQKNVSIDTIFEFYFLRNSIL